MDQKAELERAAESIRHGGLVAFPTETVYGLGANALDASAVQRIFAAKQRPATSPVIVHVASTEMARGLVREWPEQAQLLAERYWPGPITLVLPKQEIVPDVVTAGLPNVGIRMPAHPIALEMIRAAGVPVAAPSANRFAQLSPTTAQHVRESFGDSIDVVLDGGPTAVGIESSVLSLAGPHPVLLRPGGISRLQIEDVIGPIELRSEAAAEAHESPGMHPRHYSPKTPLLLTTRGDLPRQGHGLYLRLTVDPQHPATTVVMPNDAAEYARVLYGTLHEADRQQFDWIAVEKPPESLEWEAVLDRLSRASQK